MQATHDKYPVFEANQVLTNSHLNQAFNYLDEQERLTRANLIGIGIVCGLEIRLETAGAAVIHLSRGCGVTSEGYLLIEPDDVVLVSYRANYKVPNEVAYPTFSDGINQYPLWELFPAGEPDTTPLGATAGFLNDKAVLLFLELKKEGLRNCSPNDCNDKGAEMTATVRRLLIRVDDLTKIIAKANGLPGNVTSADLANVLLERLNLPDLRLPRFDVPNTGPITSNEVLAAFHAVFHTENLVQNTANALTAAYNAFKPIVGEAFPANPFAGFAANFGFLDNAPVNTTQVRFLQYYYDFFDDLLKAYDEFRWKGVELMCLCCPPEELFPRHLMLGVLFPSSVSNPANYRHYFIPSSAVSGCEAHTKELITLFRRLAVMIARFTNTPPLPLPSLNVKTDNQIRITPSKLADIPLSDKAIPYYYLQTGSPRLFELWNAERNRRRRANQNLGYRSDEYTPAPPVFVTNPLRYDLEPYNFLRIEGHLGKHYQSVLNTLLSLKTRHRLPIEIIALRTGAFDENMSVDLSKDACRFQDLEAVYDSLREELMHTLCEGVRFLYDIPIPENTDAGGTPKLPLLKNCAPGYQHKSGTVGAWFERYLPTIQNKPYIDVDQDNINPNATFFVYCALFGGTIAPPSEYFPHVVSIYYLMKLSEIAAADLAGLDYPDFENKYQDLIGLTRFLRSDAMAQIPTQLAAFVPQEELIDHFDQVLYACKLEPVKAVREEYLKRITELKQKQFLSYFLQDNPGIQHKAGVPLGGTFILVYHDDPDPVQIQPGLNLNLFEAVAGTAVAFNRQAVNQAISRIASKQTLAKDQDVRLIIGALTGEAPSVIETPPVQISQAEKIIQDTVDGLVDGTVIADFYLPYICCSDCAPVQFVLPKTPPTFTWQAGCTNPNNQAEVTITVEGGMGPYSVKIDAQAYRPLNGPLLLSAGSHILIVRDAEGTESAPQTIQIAQQLTLGEPDYDCIGNTNEYVIALRVTGGTPPYTANRGSISETVNGFLYSSDVLPGDTDVEIKITDRQGCSAVRTIRHSCLPPLTFDIQVGCTTPNNQAPTQLTVTGGRPPYQVRVDGGTFADVGAPLFLNAGSHTLLVRDADGQESAPATVLVPPALALTVVRYSCDTPDAYQALIQIEGGTPPYLVNGNPITGIQFTSDPIRSGSSATLEVMDFKKCSASITLQHTCEEPCNLPCDGISLRCAYRLWLQPAVDEAPYETYRRTGAISFRFNGIDIGMPGTNTALQLDPAELNNNYQDAMAAAIKQLNTIIEQALVRQLGEEGRNRLVMGFEGAETDPFGIFWIEHFVCDTFSIEFNYTYAKPSPNFTLTMRYTNEPLADGTPFNGAVMLNRRLDNKETRVPAFDCSRRNQCADGEFQKLCEGPEPKPTMIIEPLGDNLFLFAGEVPNLPAEEIQAWVWDVLSAGASEPFYEGQKVDNVQLRTPEGRVRLTAITTKGCFGFVDQNIQR